MGLNKVEVNSIPSLIECVLEIANRIPPENSLWFRGQECSDFSLLPKLLRSSKSPEQIRDREDRLLARFRQRSIAYWREGYLQSEWDHLFAMQHYGMPTRLLDWSENLLIACYFALNESLNTRESQPSPTIWAVDPVAWNRANPYLGPYAEIQVLTTANEEVNAYKPERGNKIQRHPIAIYGTHNSERIVAQRGTFIVWGRDTDPMETLCASDVICDLWKLELKGDVDELRRSLRLLGYAETMIFPELSSLAAELTRTEHWR